MESNGFLFAATGPRFRAAAVEAARGLRQHCPEIAIDLVTDAPPDENIFDEIRLLKGPVKFPKVQAMLGSRFAQTIYLDADIRVVGDISDIFDVLDRFDLTFAHDQMRNSDPALRTWRQHVPNAFPQANGGLIGYHRTPEVMAFLETWDAAISDHGIGKDQPSLRELLWKTQLRFAVLPPEYNFWNLKQIDAMNTNNTAPRIIHARAFTSHPPAETKLVHALGKWRAARLEVLLRADRTLPGSTRTPSRREKLHLKLAWLLHVMARLTPTSTRRRLRYGKPPNS